MDTRDIGSFGNGSRTRILDGVVVVVSVFVVFAIDGTRSRRRGTFELLVENIVDSFPILRFGGREASFFVHYVKLKTLILGDEHVMLLYLSVGKWPFGLFGYVMVGELIEKVLGFLFQGGTQPEQLNTLIANSQLKQR